MSDKFTDLPHYEKNIFIGKLIHAISRDSSLFIQANSIVSEADRKGLFENVKFGKETVTFNAERRNIKT